VLVDLTYRLTDALIVLSLILVVELEENSRSDYIKGMRDDTAH
jgi:hypothetical protein